MDKEVEWLLKEKYRGEKSDAFFADVRRLVLGEPLGYLIGHVPFLNTTIYLDSRPLVPRPETEYWTEKAIAQMGPKTTRVLDLCAGSGCIGVAVAKALPHVRVDFAEIDATHIPTIEKNLERNNIQNNRTTIVHSNLLENVRGRYDFILSNPPYIDMALERTDTNVLEHEPYLALSGGQNGMEIIELIISSAPKYLTEQGQLWLEHEPEQEDEIRILGQTNSFTVTTHQDQYGTPRYSVLVVQ